MHDDNAAPQTAVPDIAGDAEVAAWQTPLGFEGCIPLNRRDSRPRGGGWTMVRDTGMGPRALSDLCEASGPFVDVLKIACGAMVLQPASLMRRKIDIAREFGIEYSTGGVIERVVLAGSKAVHRFLDEAAEMGFAEIEVSSGAVIMSLADKLELVRAVLDRGMRPVPEVAMAYGLVPGEVPTVNADKLVHEVKACLEAGAPRVLIEEEGLTQGVERWRTDIIFRIATCCPLDRLIFEVENRAVYSWYIQHFGPQINLHVDPRDINHLEATRRGLWGKGNVWGKVATFER